MRNEDRAERAAAHEEMMSDEFVRGCARGRDRSEVLRYGFERDAATELDGEQIAENVRDIARAMHRPRTDYAGIAAGIAVLLTLAAIVAAYWYVIESGQAWWLS